MSTAEYAFDKVPRTQSLFPKLGFLYVVAVPLLAGVGTARADSLSISGLNYTGFLWLSAMIIGIGLLSLKMLVPGRLTYFPLLLWMPWVCVIWFSFAWSDSPATDQVQAALQLSMPVLIGAVAGALVESRRQLAQLMRAYYWTVPILWLSAIAWLLFDVTDHRGPLYIEIRGLSLTAVLISGVAIAGTDRSKGCWLIWAACLAISVPTGGRMATLTMLLLPVLNPINTSLLRRVTIATFIVLMGLALLATPVFQDRFFGGDHKGISDIASGDFEDMGRFEVWPVVLDEALERPLLGHGIGTVQRLIPELWNEVVQPHNDYLRIGYEVGIVGLTIFLFAFGVQFILVTRYIACTQGIERQAFAGAWLGMVAFLVVACTDNPISYMLLFMNPLFALLGAAYAVAHRQHENYRYEDVA